MRKYDTTVRVIVKDKKETIESELRSFLKDNGAEIEGIEKGFFAVDVAPSVDLKKILSHLCERKERGDWDYEEGKVPEVNG